MTRHFLIFLFQSRALHFVSMIVLLALLEIMAAFNGAAPFARETVHSGIFSAPVETADKR